MKNFALAFIVAFLAITVTSSRAATYTITTDQNWSTLSPQPTSGDAVIVQNGANLTVDVAAGSCATIQLGVSGSAGPGTLTFNSGRALTCADIIRVGDGNQFGTLNLFFSGTLRVGGSLIFTPGVSSFVNGSGTVEYNSAGAQTITAATYGSLATSGSGTKSLGGTVTVNANLTVGTGTTLDVTTTNNVLVVKGAWNNNGDFLARAGTVTLNGTSVQSVSGTTTFNNLTLNNSAGLTANANITVSSNLTFTNGRITTGANTIFMGSGGSVSNVGSTRYVVGNLQKTFDGGAGQSFTFPIGNITRYTPVTLTSLSVTSPGTLAASTISSEHPDITNSGLDPLRDVNRYWRLTSAGGLGVSSCNGTFNFVSADLDFGAATGSFVVRKFNGTSWSATTTGTRTSTSAQATGLSSFGDFAVGEQLIDHYLVSASSPQTAGQAFTTTITAQDILNQTVVADSSTSVTMSSSTGNAFFDADGNGTFDDPQKTLVNGTFSISTKDNTVETVDLIATDDFLRTGTRSGVVIQAGAGTVLAFVQQPSNAAAGTSISPAVTVRAQDLFGNNVAGASVTMALGSGSGTLSGTLTRTTDGSGIATFNDLSIQLAGTKTLSASVSGGTPVLSSAFTISGTTATKLAFTTQPGNASAGAPFGTQPVVKSQDTFGNDSAIGLPANLTLTMALNSGTGPLQGTTTMDIGTAAGNGVAAFSNLRIDPIGTKQLVASAPGLSDATSSNFTVGPGAANRLVIQTQPSSTATAGIAFAQQPVIRVEDQFGNLLTSDNSTVVTATRLGGSGTLQGTTNITVSGGQAAFGNLAHTVATNITIQFTSGSLASTTSTAIAVSPGAANRLVMQTQPSSTAVAGVAFATQPVVRVEDAFGNWATNDNSTVVRAARNAGTSSLQGTTNITASGGLAAFVNLAYTVAESITINFTSGSLTSATSSSITISPAAASMLAMRTNPPATATVGVPFNPAPVVAVVDQFTNVITTDSSTVVTATRSAGTGSLTGTTNVTALNGLAAYTNLAHDSVANITIRFAASGLTSVTSSPVAVGTLAFSRLQVLLPGETAAPGTASGKTGTPTPQTAGTPFNITVNATDDIWNVVSTNDTVHISSSDPNAILPADAALVGGTKTFSVTLKTAGSLSVTASDVTHTAKSPYTAALTVNAGLFAKLQILAPGETAAPGTASGKTGTPTAQLAGTGFNVTVNAVDANWNVVPTVSDFVGITSSDANAILPTSAALLAGTRDFSVTLRTAGSRTVTATDITDGTKTASTSGSIAVGVGPFVKLQLLMPGETATPGSITGKTGTPSALTAGAATNVTVNAVDASWNLVTNVTHTVHLTSSDLNAALSANTALVAGTNRLSLTFKTAGSQTVTASDVTDGTKTPDTSPAFTVNAGAVTKLQVLVAGEFAQPGTPSGKAGTPNNQTAGFAVGNGVVVNAVDANWNVVTTATTNVTISSSDTNAVIADDNGAMAGNVTLVGGTRTLSSLTFKTAGTRTVSVTGGTLASDTSGSVTVEPGPFAKLQVLAPGEAAAPGSASGKVGTPSAQSAFTAFNVTVNAVDTNWNRINTVTDGVRITSSDSSATLPADADLVGGTAPFHLSLNTVGSATVTATDLTDGTITANTSASIPVSAAQFTRAEGGSAISADAAVTGTFTSLSNLVYRENAGGNAGVGTIILKAPGGFIFDTNAPLPNVLITRLSGSGGPGNNINDLASGNTSPMTSITPTQLVFTVSAASASGFTCSLTWQNLRVRPTNGVVLASGIVTRSGTATVVGMTANSDLGTLREVPGAPNRLAMQTEPSATATAGVAFAQQPAVLVQDQFGNVRNAANGSADNSTVVSASRSFGSGILQGTTNRTAVDGVVTFTDLAHNVATNITIQFGSGALVTATSSIIAVGPAPVGQLAFITQPGNATAGAAFGTQPVVQAQDLFGNASTVNLPSSRNVTVSLSAGTGALQGTTTLDIGSAAGNGTVAFSNLRIDATGTDKQLTASASGLTSGVSDVFTVSPAAASQLAIQTEPSATATAGVPFSQQPVIRIEDAFGNLRSADNTTTVTAIRSGGSGTLQGTTTRTAVNGIVSFTDLSHNVAGNITISFTSGGLTPALSSTVTVNPAAASRLAIATQPSATATAGALFAQQPVIRIEDAFGNLRSSDNTTIVSTARNNGAGILQGTTNLTAVGGVVAYTNLSHNLATNITISFSSTGLASTNSSNIAVSAGAFARLLLLAPGETSAPATITGKSNAPSAQIAGTEFPVAVKAVDAFWNAVTNVSDVVEITSSDSNALLPAQATLVNGTNTFNVTLKTGGSQSLTATDLSNGAKTPNTSTIPVGAGAFTKLQLLLPGESAAPGTLAGKTGTPTAQTAGTPFNVTVNAVDANWNVATNVADIAGISSTDANASLPANAALVAGTGLFSVTLKTAGSATMTATDITNGARTPSTSSSITVNAGAFAKLQLLVPGETAAPGTTTGKTGAPLPQTVAVPFSVTVRGVDANWNLVNTAADIVEITSSDSNANLPADAALVGGTRTFNVTFRTSGTRTITAGDASDGTRGASSSPGITVAPGPFVKLQLLVPGETAVPGSAAGKTGTPAGQIAGSVFNVTVNAVDADWNVATSVGDLVSVTSSDANATATNAPLVAGTKTLGVTLKTAGSAILTATDLADVGKAPSSSPSIAVNAGAFAKLQLLTPGETATPGTVTGKTGTPNSQIADVGFSITVNAVDANWNLVSTNDTVRITSSDSNAALPADQALVNGTKNFVVTLKTAGTATITASNVTHAAIAANTSAAITVSAGPFAKMQLLVPGEAAAPGSASGKTGTPTAQTAGTPFNVTVNAVDANWNVATNVTDVAAITSSDPNAALPGAAALVAGTRNFSVTLKTAGALTITATNVTDGTKASNTSPSITLNPGAFTKLQLLVPGETAAPGSSAGKTGASATQIAGTSFSVTARSVDANWNLVTNVTDTVRITSSDSNAILPPDAALVAGSKTFTVTLKTTPAQTVTASDFSDPTKTANTSPSISVIPGAAARLAVQTQPSLTATAGVAFAQQPVIRIEDASGNLVTNDSSSIVTAVRLAGSGTLQGTTALTAINGLVVFTNLAHNVATNITIQFTSGSLASTTSTSIAIKPAAANRLAIQIQPSAIAVAGVAFTNQPVIRIEDAFGNLVTNDNSTVVHATRATGSSSLQGTTNVTASGGLANFANLSYNVAETISISFSAGTLNGATSGSIIVNPAAANRLAIQTQPSTSATAGVTFAQQPVIRIEDQFGNLRSSDSTAVTATRNGGSGTLQGTTSLSALNGVVAFTNLSHNVATNITILFSSGSLSSTTSTPIAISPAPVNRLVFATQPGGGTAGTVFPIQPVVRTQDQFGNNSTNNLSSSLNVTMTLTTGTGPLQGTVTRDIGTAVGNGIATFTDLRIDVAGTNKQLTASATGLSSAVSALFSVVPAAATKLTIATQPSLIATAGVAFAQQPMIRVEDAFNNLVSSDNSSVVTASRASGTGTLQGTTSVTAVNGLVTFANLSYNTAGTITLQFASGSLTSATSVNVLVRPASATRLTIQSQPSATATAGLVFVQQPVVRIEDQFGNVVTNDNTTVVTAARSAGSGTLQGTTTATAVAGIATFGNLSHNVANTITINFTSGSLTSVVSDNVAVNSAAFSKLQLLVPGETAAPGTASGKTGTPNSQSAFTAFNVTLNAVDAFWNLVNSVTDSVRLTSSDSSATLPPDAALSGGTKSLAISLNTVGAATITAADVIDGTKTASTSPSITVSAARFTRAQGGTAIPADGAVTGTFTTLSNLVYSEAANGDVGLGTIILNIPSGFVFDTNTPLPTVAITELVNGGGPSTEIAGTVTSVTSTQIVFNVTRTSSSGTANALTWQNVRVRPTSGTVLASGILTRSGSAPVVGLTTNADLGTLREVAGAANKFVLQTQPSSTAIAGVPFAQQPVLLIQDQFGNFRNSSNGVADNSTIVLANRSAGSGTLQGTTSRTATNGVVTFLDLSHNIATNITILFSSAGVTSTTSTAVAISPAAVAQLGFTTQPGSATAGTIFGSQPVVQSQDPFGNFSTTGLPASLNVGLALANGTGPLQGATTLDIGTAAGNGTVSFSNLRIDAAGTNKQLSASATGLNSGLSSVFTVSPAAATSLNFVQPPSDATAGAVIAPAVTVRALDNFGNGVPGVSITISLSTGTGSLNGTTTQVTSLSGVATFADLSVNVTGSKRLTAAGNALSTGESSSFVINPAAANRLAIQTQPSTTAIAGVPFSQQPVLRIEDQFGNLVSGDITTVVTATRAAGSGTLQGTTTATAVNGVATFVNLAHNLATNITIQFTSGGLAAVTSTAISISPGDFTKLQLLVPGELAAPGTTTGKTGSPSARTAGTAFNVTVNAVDASWNLVNTVTDTIRITSSDTNAVLPADTALIGGTQTLSATLKTAGTQTLTASNVTDIAKAANTSPAITVNAGAVAKLQLLLPGETAAPGSASGKIGTPAVQVAGTTITNGIVVNAVDANWNIVSSAANNITITSTDPNAVIANDNGATAGNMTLIAGTRTLSSFLFRTAGLRTITATDAAGALTANTSPSVTVTAGAVTKLQILVPGEIAAPGTTTGKTGTPNSQTTLTPIIAGVIVNAVDANWNLVAAATTNVTITSSDTSAVIADDNAGTNGNITLAGGTATLSSFAFAVSGTQTITATNSGLTASTSGNITVNSLATTTALASSQDPSVFGQQIIFTATATSSIGTPTGTVTFREGATVLGTQPLNGSQAKLTNSTFSVTSHPITATYNGTPTYAASTSATVTQIVNAASTSTTLASSLTPACFGQSVTFTATVIAVPPASGSPTGTVTFKDGAVSLVTNTVSLGQAAFTTTTLSAGSHPITAVFKDGISFNSSTSAILTQLVFAKPTAVVSGGGTICPAGTATIQAALTGTSPWNVTWSDGITQTGVTSSPALRTVSPSSTTTYSVATVTDANCSNPGTGSATVTVNTPPSISGQPSSATVCENSPASFSVTASGSNLTYQWRRSGTNLSNGGNISGATSATLSINPAALSDTAPYSVVVSGTCPLAVTSSVVTLTVNPLPNATITAASTIRANCSGARASVPDGGVGATYLWSLSAGTINSGQGTRAITYTAPASGTSFTIAATVTKLGCSRSSTNTVALLGSGGIVLEGWKNTPSAQWQSATLHAPDAVYAEGATVPYRLTLTQPCADWSITIGYDFEETASAAHFFDFLTSYNGSESSVTNHECDGRTCVGSTTSFPIPRDSVLAYQIPGNFKVLNGAITSVGSYSTVAVSGITQKRLTISGTNGGGDVVILFGAHLARDTEWGTGKGAAQWPNATANLGFVNYSSGGSPGSLSLSRDGLINDQPQADLAITKFDSPDPICPGNELTYTLVVSNGGPAAAAVTLTDNLPSGVTFVSCNATDGGVCDGSGNNRTVTFSSLAAGASATVTITASVNNSGPGTLSNSATVSSSVADPNILDNSATTSAVIGNALSITCPANLTTNTAPDQCFGIVMYATPGTSGGCGAVTINCLPPSGGNFPAGLTTVHCTAIDSIGVSNSCSFTVTVEETQAPAIACPVDLVISTDAGQCSRSNVTYSVNATDNCGGVSVNCLPPSGSTFAKGTNTVNCAATDSSSNMAACSFKVIVTDTEAPMVSCPANILSITDAGQCTRSNVTYVVTAWDNCPGVSFSCTPASGSTFAKGATTVSCDAIDAAGNTSSCSFTVTINDSELPTITCPANIITNTAQGVCAAVVTWPTPIASDNCAISSVVCVPASGSTFAHGVTPVTCTATDTSGNSKACAFNVTVNDAEAPALAGCPATQTVNTDPGLCTAVVNWNAPTATDNCDFEVEVVCTPASGTAFVKGTTHVTCTASDSASNSSQCGFDIIVVDAEMPNLICPANIVKNADPGVCTATATWTAPLASDNCAIASVVCTPASGSTFAAGTTPVTCAAVDTSGNSNSCAFTVTVEDHQLPTISCPSDIVVNTVPGGCSSNVNFVVTVSDNCPGVGYSCVPPSGSLFPKGTTLVTCTAIDASDNMADCSFNVTVQDHELPAITCPANIVVSTSPGICSSNVSFAASVTDNCPDAAYACVPPSGSAFAKGTNLVTCTATDASGNMANCSFTVTVQDHELPAILCPGNILVNTSGGSCSSNVVFAPTVSDNCSGVTYVCTPPTGSSFAKGVTPVACVVTDASGNSASCNFTVTVEDHELPHMICPANLVVNTAPGSCASNVTFAATATDNCSGVTFACLPPSGSSFAKGTNTVACTATDASGNMANCSFTVTVEDRELPSIICPGPILVHTSTDSCASNVTFAVTVADNCPNPTSVCVPPGGSSFAKGINPVNCTAMDASGNTASCSFTVTVEDHQLPTITCPGNIVTNTAAGTCARVVNFTPTFSDNCPSATVSCTPASGASFAKGTTTVNCTATDASGNTANCSFSVTVNDAELPTITCPANIVTNTAAGTCARVVSFAPTFGDNCPGASVNCMPASGTSFAKGTTTVNCTATDASDNTANCSFSVTVLDTEAPNLTCPGDLVTNVNPVTCTRVVSFTASVTDNCPDVTLTCQPASGSSFPLGVTLVTCTATNVSGSGSSCSFHVTVGETNQPILSIERQGANVVLSWPVTCATYVLERTDDLTSPIQWTAAGGTVSVADGHYTVTFEANSTVRYYQLRQQ